MGITRQPLYRSMNTLVDPVPAEAAPENQVRTFTISTPSVDREGDIMDPTGCNASDYLKNPVVLWAHDYTSLPVGRTKTLTIRPDAIVSDVEFAPTAFAQQVKSLIDGGYIKGASIGFLPADGGAEPITDSQGRVTGTKYTKWHLLEWSLVPVPSNQEALAHMVATAKTKGLAVDAVELALKAIPQTKEVSTVDVKADNWTVGGARNLPVNADRSWDAGAARKRLAAWAGGPEKDKVDWGKYGKAFIVHNAADKENFGSYKFPFADVVDGKLTAIKRGLIAARAVLNGGRGGADIGGAADAAKAFVDSYLGKEDDEGKGLLGELEQAWAESDAYKKALLDAAMGDPEALAKSGAVLSRQNKERLVAAGKHLDDAAETHGKTGGHLKSILKHHDAADELHQKVLDRFTDADEMVRSMIGIRSVGGDATNEVGIRGVKPTAAQCADDNWVAEHPEALRYCTQARAAIAVVKAAEERILKDAGQPGLQGGPGGNPVPAPPMTTGGPGTSDVYTGGGTADDDLRRAHRAIKALHRMVKALTEPLDKAARAREKASLTHENVAESIPAAGGLLKDVLNAAGAGDWHNNEMDPGPDDGTENGSTGKGIVVIKEEVKTPVKTESAPVIELDIAPSTLKQMLRETMKAELDAVLGRVS